MILNALSRICLLTALAMATVAAEANGVLRNGLGARAMGFGGAGLVLSDDPLSAMNSNPAALGNWRQSEFVLNLTSVFIDAEYSNVTTAGTDAGSNPGIFPDLAYIQPLTDRLTLGASVSPVAADEIDWEYVDPPGTLGISYGLQTHKASFLALRSSLGLGYEINPQFSLGASVGLIYNRNRLTVPYIFQTHPVLAGIKVLTNLEADGFGWNGVFSASYRPRADIELNLSYTTQSTFEATGEIKGFAPLGIGSFIYDAEVGTSLPQIASAAIAWQYSDPLRVGFQVDWIDWSDAFDRLPLHLTHGNNAVLNGIAGSTTIDDVAPLDWKDQFVYRIGSEYDWSGKLQLRAGYSYGESPVQSETLTATTAAIMQHTLGLGFSYQLPGYRIDFGYQWDLPAEDAVGNNSRILAGEYNNSEVDVSIHWLSVGISLTDPFKTGK